MNTISAGLNLAAASGPEMVAAFLLLYILAGSVAYVALSELEAQSEYGGE